MAKVRKKLLRVLQVSDCHVSADAAAHYRGHSADRNLKKLLPVMRAWDPDLVLLTGDVSEDGSAAAYARVAVMLGTIGSPVLALPGNHDDPETMKEHFGQGPWNGPLAVEMGRWLMVLLDSTERNRVSGALSQQALERFDELLRGSTAEFVLVALHHQPVPVDSPWIDRYALENPELFLHFIAREPRVRCVAWGHIHQDFQAELNGTRLLGSPSTVANSLPKTPRFTLDMGGPSCRWLELGADGTVETGVLRPG